jgi:hypothetical protein
MAIYQHSGGSYLEDDTPLLRSNGRSSLALIRPLLVSGSLRYLGFLVHAAA